MAYDFSRLEVLVVDADDRMRGLAVALLGGIGIRTVRQSDSVAAAFDSLKESPCDLVLSAWEMTPQEGIELSRLIRQDGNSPNPFLPVIVYTDNTDRYRLMTVREAGVSEFVETPLNAENLYRTIVSVVENPRPFVRAKSYFGPDRRGPEPAYDGRQRQVQRPPAPDRRNDETSRAKR